jgi:hypothetical protein
MATNPMMVTMAISPATTIPNTAKPDRCCHPPASPRLEDRIPQDRDQKDFDVIP